VKVYVHPHGTAIQKHYEELRAGGMDAAEASAASRIVEVDWPWDIRLPVSGDYIEAEWAFGRVNYVAISVDAEKVGVVIKLEA
jgi:alkylhydroperoxidase family enzyme